MSSPEEPLPPEPVDTPLPPPISSTRQQAYWRANLKVVGILLGIWFLVAYVGSIFCIQWLDQFSIGNLGFGFWLAQQGSIFVFVILVLVYALWMDRIDRSFDVGE